MTKKIIAFQKMMLHILFAQFLNTKSQTFKSKKNKFEGIILAIFPIITYFMGYRLFGGLMGFMFFSIIMLPHLYKIFCTNESIIFHLPLKRSFIILNSYFISTFISVISILVMFFIISLTSAIPALISALTGDFRQLSLTKFDIAMLQGIIFLVLYVIIYMNGITVSFFVKSSKLRITIIILFTSIYSFITLYIYNILPKDPKQSHFELINSILLVSNSWVYVAIVLCAAIIVTLCGIFISIRFNTTKNCNSNIA